MQEMKDGFHERLQFGGYSKISKTHASTSRKTNSRRTLRLALVCDENATPSIHDTLAQGQNIVEHLEGNVRAGRDEGSLLQHGGNNGQIGVELSSDGLGNIAKGLQDGRFQLVGVALSNWKVSSAL